MRAVAIVPDGKDWTWVLERPCPECGFDAGAFDVRTTAERIRRFAVEWTDVLSRPDVRDQPDAATWSPLEYGCHIRDVFRIYDGRLDRMLTEDGPEYLNWDQDATAVEERYSEQDPTVIAGEMQAAAAVLADRFELVTGDAWSRTGARSDGARFTIDSFARYLVHDPYHHLHDVGAI